MSLLNPHLGELLDRYSILTMKLHAKPEEKSFLEEHAEIRAAIKAKTGAPGEGWLATAELGAINGRIWELVALAHNGFAILSVDLQRLNEARARAIRRLGELAGAQAPDLDEKVY